ncbi:glycosyltransferase [Paenibacillus gansuensis]|uniref:Glycosyltransferase n=1 Tax=Paenibacillus gansuensis TaxID=306542 RepID=A0ABW5PJE0_9BACL
MEKYKIAMVKLFGEYLPLTETFIYSELANIKNYDVTFYTKKITNADQFPFKDVRLFNNMEDLEKSIIENNIQLIHARFGPSGIGIINLKKKLGLPLLTSFHGFDVPTNKRPVYTKQLSNLFDVGEAFTTTSIYMKNILTSYGCDESKIIVQNSGININTFIKNDNFKNKNDNKVIIISAGRLIEKKGMEYLIKGFYAASKVYPNIHLRIIGEGELFQPLSNLVINLGIQDKVEFIGSLPHSEIVKEFNNADIFALCSIEDRVGNQEGIPNVLKEAMACSLPILSTQHAGIPELVHDGLCGFLVPEKDSESIAEKLIKLIESRSMWNVMGQQGRNIIEHSFNNQKQIPKLEGIYSKLITNANIYNFG